MKLCGIAVLCLLSGLSLAQQSQDPVLRSAAMPHYPPLARQARIQGQVKLEFVINQSGEVASVNIESGHPLLGPAAVDTVKSWRFDASGAERKGETIFDFKIALNADPRDVDKISVTTDSFRHVEIQAWSSEFQVSDCPSEKDKTPPVSIMDTDFAEMSTTSCMGSCPAYTVRISADGNVTWRGEAYVEAKGIRHASVQIGAARDLLERFRSAEFWALCGSYSRNVTDSAGTEVKVRIGGRSKTVSEYADSAPGIVTNLEFMIGSVANTHFWQHGDPAVEPITRLGQDGYIPKPGVTPLMRAAARSDAKVIRELLKDNADISATDASGWTPLMYAAVSSHSEPVQLLLTAGANPNQVSARGDSPLMVAATERMFDETLAHAGADVNARNTDGVTALMILAASGEVDEIRSALKAGAELAITDAKGRTALDYLRLANCGKSPIRDEIQEWESISYGTCKAFDDNDFHKAEQLLTPPS